MASTIKVTNIDTPDNTGNIIVDRPLSGSGASLTNLPAANLTGTIVGARLPDPLPAISGASLTNLPAGGKLLQYIYHTYTTRVDIDNTAWVNTGSTATLVTSAVNSKILCTYHINGIQKHTNAIANTSAEVFLQKDSVDVQRGAYYIGYGGNGVDQRFTTLSNTYLSPTISSASTSVVFRTRAKGIPGIAGVMSYQSMGEVSSMILMEFGA